MIECPDQVDIHFIHVQSETLLLDCISIANVNSYQADNLNVPTDQVQILLLFLVSIITVHSYNQLYVCIHLHMQSCLTSPHPF